MIYCLECRHFSPAQSVWCTSCRKTFNGVRCPKGHLTRMVGREHHCCSTCGSEDVSQFARSINLRPLSRGIAWLIAIIIGRFVCGHLFEIGGLAANIAAWGISSVLGVPITHLVCVVVWVCVLLIITWVTSLFLPAIGPVIRRHLIFSLRLGLTGAWRLACLIARAVFRLVEGSSRSSKETSSDTK